MKTRILIVGIVILSLLVMGCNVCSLATKKGKEIGATKVAEELEKVVEEKLATPTSTKEPQAKSEEPQPEAPKPGTDDDTGVVFDGDEVVGWDSLDSYRYELSMQANQDGEKATIEGSGAVTKDPPAMQADIEVTSDKGESQTLRFIRAEGRIYLYDPARKGWMVMEGDSPMAAGVDLVDMIMKEMIVRFDSTKFSRMAEQEPMNGVSCSKYHAAAKDIEVDFLEGKGEITAGDVYVWIANEWGVLIRYVMDIEGKDAEGNPAGAQFTLNVLDVNQSVKIAPPPESEILGDLGDAPGLPLPQDTDGIAKTLPKPEGSSELEGVELAAAQALAETSDHDLYKIPLSVEEAVAYYEKAYADAGWDKQTSPPVAEGVAILIFAKEGRTVTVMINGMFSTEAPMVVVYVQ
jgi:hypothetical protein